MAGRGKPKTGGRRAGTPNKDKGELLALIRTHVGDQDFHPVLAMADIATAILDDGSPKYGIEVRTSMLKEVSQYVAPKLKAIEHTADIDGLGLNLHMSIGPAPKKKGNGARS